jgi:hypothetical protein
MGFLFEVVALAAQVALGLGRQVALASSPRLAAPSRDDRDRPYILSTPCAPLRTAGALPTAPAGSIDTPTRRRYTRAGAGPYETSPADLSHDP